MYFNQKVVNGNLGGAISTMKANKDAQSRELVMEEILKATFLCPATVSMPPIIDEDGELNLPDGCVINHQMVVDSVGTPLLLAFTSEDQMNLWLQKTGKECYGFACSFLEYADLMLKKLPDGSRGPAQGFVIDPMESNLVVDRDMVANLILRLQKRG